MEVLTLMLHRRVRVSDSFTFHHKCSKLNIINLCFADDLFLFAHGDANSAQVIMDALDEFKLASGLTPSLPKSTAYFCNVLNHVKIAILQVLPFEEGVLPVKYLGVPLVTTRLIFRDCKELVERLANRIKDWRNKSLSFAGRLQLIQSVLSSMHIYWASVFILPSSIIQDLEQLMRGFLWSHDGSSRGRSKVAWDVVCLPKHEGGLGIRSLSSFNNALITSHIWSIVSGKDSLWVKWIHMYKLKERNFWDVPCRGNMTWSWRKILQLRPIVRRFIWYNLGNGSKVSAWFDSWCDLSPLSLIVSSRDIHRAGFFPDSKVSDIVRGNGWAWPNQWSVRYHSLNSIAVPHLLNHMDDRLVWRNSDGSFKHFSVSLAWECIRPRGSVVGWSHVVWFTHRIPRHAFHTWLVIKRRLTTQDKLTLVDDNCNLVNLLCPLCEMQPDSHEHLFFECSFSSQVWISLKVFADLGMLPLSLDAIISFLTVKARSRSARSVVSKLLFAATSYVIWQERNNRIFKQQKRTEAQVVDFIQATVRMKLLTCRFKRTANLSDLVRVWKLPPSLIHT
jgi:hypothetical protein